MSKCKVCGGEFEQTRPHQIYCSEQCGKKANNAQAVKRYSEKNGDLSPRPCIHCGLDYTPKRRDSRFCSKLCNAHYLRDNPTDFISDPEQWAVTTPYGSHAFDSWVQASFQRAAA